MIGRRDQKRDMRPALLNIFGKVQSVHGAWHVDIREENLHVIGARFQDSQRNIGVGCLQDMKAGILQIVSRCHPHKRLILDQQNDRGSGVVNNCSS